MDIDEINLEREEIPQKLELHVPPLVLGRNDELARWK